MDRNEAAKILNLILEHRIYFLTRDLAQMVDQKAFTTKHARREKALAYVLEFCSSVDSSLCGVYPSTEWVLSFLDLIEALKGQVHSPESKTALERSEQRLRYALEHPVHKISGWTVCVGCKEVIKEGADHQCTNISARARDSTMGRDPDVVL